MLTQNKFSLRRFFDEIFNWGDLATADAIGGLNDVNHNPAPGETPDRAGLKVFVTLLPIACPNVHFTLEHQIATGDKVLTRFTITGTQHGAFAAIPATGKPIRSPPLISTVGLTATSRPRAQWGCARDDATAKCAPGVRLGQK
jgi:hypothetical protein